MHLVPRGGLLSLLLPCASVVPASAALRIAVGTSGAKLAVSADGRALVTWTQGGAHRTAVVTGSRVRYAGTITRSATAVKVAPTVPFALVQMRLPSGEQFALQVVPRLSEGATLGPAELYLARWRGDATDLTVLAGDAKYALSIKSDLAGSQYRATIIGPNVGGDLAPVASAVTPASPTGTCPFPPGTYKGE